MIKSFEVNGFKYDTKKEKMTIKKFDCFIADDGAERTFTIYDGNVQFTIGLEQIERFLRWNS